MLLVFSIDLLNVAISLSLSVLGDVIDYLRLCNIETFVFMGDLNVDLLTDSNESLHLKQLLSFNDCQQLVESPTRITELSESLLDVFIVNSDLMMANAEVLDMCISDHNVIKCRLQLHIESIHRSPKTLKSFKKFEYDSFSRDAEAIDWNRIYSLPNLDLKVNYFNETLISLFDSHAPYITVKQQSRKPSPWFTPFLQTLKRLKQRAWTRYKKSRSSTYRRYFYDLRIYYNSALASEKKAYFAGKMLQLALPWIVQPLTHIVNLSFELGSVPSA